MKCLKVNSIKINVTNVRKLETKYKNRQLNFVCMCIFVFVHLIVCVVCLLFVCFCMFHFVFLFICIFLCVFVGFLCVFCMRKQLTEKLCYKSFIYKFKFMCMQLIICLSRVLSLVCEKAVFFLCVFCTCYY